MKFKYLFFLLVIVLISVGYYYRGYFEKFYPKCSETTEKIVEVPVPTVCPEIQKDIPLEKIIANSKLLFLKGKFDQNQRESLNKFLPDDKKINFIGKKSIFELLEDFENAKLDLLKNADLSEKNKTIVKKIYKLISGQFYIERNIIDENSSKVEVELAQIEKQLKNFEFSNALELSMKLKNMSQSFDKWMGELQIFCENLSNLERLE